MTEVFSYKGYLRALHRQINLWIEGQAEPMFETSCVSYLNFMNSMIWYVENLHVGQLPINQNWLAWAISEADRA